MRLQLRSEMKAKTKNNEMIHRDREEQRTKPG